MKSLTLLGRLLPGLGVLAAVFSPGCRQVDQAAVDATCREVADLGSAAQVGFSPQDLRRMGAAFDLGDPEHADELYGLARRGLRTAAEVARLNSATQLIQGRVRRGVR